MADDEQVEKDDRLVVRLQRQLELLRTISPADDESSESLQNAIEALKQDIDTVEYFFPYVYSLPKLPVKN